jgi:hypothetical protein
LRHKERYVIHAEREFYQLAVRGAEDRYRTG